jgi:hypothetical protein
MDDGRCGGGIGLVLTHLGNGFHLMGIDLDQCLTAEGEDRVDVNDFADSIIERFNTFTEVSPSGQGAKLFFLVAANDMDAINDLLDGKKRKAFTKSQHSEMAIDRDRYYAVTERPVGGAETLRIVGVEDIRWFIKEAGPQFLRDHQGNDGEDGRARRRRDDSGSGKGFRYLATCKAYRLNHDGAMRAILADAGPAGEWARERADERELEQTWRNAPIKVLDDIELTPPTVSARELQNMEFPELKYVVPDILPEGLTLLAGKPKVGKSFFGLQVGNAVANGSSALGGDRCEAADVLYCALEDNERRLQWRLKKMQISRWSRRLQFWCQMPRLNEGGLHMIEQWIKSVRHPGLIVVDTLAKVRPLQGKTENTQYAADYQALADLHALALRYHLAIIVVHHQRKMDADDPFDTVSGTLGLTGAADTIVLLLRDHGGYLLLARGRDILEIEKAMSFDSANCHWQLIGDADKVRTTRQRAAIMQAMKEIDTAASPKEIASAAELPTTNVNKTLKRMTRDGLIFQWSRGRYSTEREPRRERDRAEGED